MSWHYLQGAEEASWEGNSSDGSPSALSRLMPTVGGCCSPGNETGCSGTSPYGTTSGPLTGGPGAATSALSPGDSLVRTSVLPGRERASKDHEAGSGARWPASLAKWRRDTHSWRTPQLLLFEDSGECLVTFPRWGMTRGGELWERETLVPRTSGSGSGSWPTPSARDWKDTPGMSCEGVNPDGSVPDRADQLARAVYHGGGPTRQTYPPPRAEDAECSGGHRGKDDTLYGMVCRPKEERNWPTPCLPGNGGSYGKAKLKAMLAESQQKNWPTPTKSDATVGPGASEKREGGENLRPLGAGSLNPSWVEWLLGWPIGWTDLKPLAMDRFLAWRRMHSSF